MKDIILVQSSYSSQFFDELNRFTIIFWDTGPTLSLIYLIGSKILVCLPDKSFGQKAWFRLLAFVQDFIVCSDEI